MWEGGQWENAADAANMGRGPDRGTPEMPIEGSAILTHASGLVC